MNAWVHKAKPEVASKQRVRTFGPAPQAVNQPEIQLHRALGNQAYGHLIQAKLTINRPGDAYEQEADRIADKVMRMPAELPAPADGPTEPQHVQRLRTGGEEGGLQARAAPRPSEGSAPAMETRLQALRSGGRTLPEPERAFFEPRFGHDFSGVRIHSGAEAAQLAQSLRAQAFTVGEDVVFGAGRYAPQTSEGQRLIAHELTHVVQQRAHVRSVGEAARARPRHATPAATVQRAPNDGDVVEVEIVEAPPAVKGSVKDIALDNLNTIQGMLVNFDGALRIFAKVVESSSKEEAAPKATGLIVLDEVGKFVFDKLVDHATSLVPGGSVAKDFIGLSKSVLEAVDKEKKRSGAATEENALKDFIVDLQTKITTATSSLLAAKQNDAVEVEEKYNNKATEGEKAAYRRWLEYENHRLTQLLEGPFSVASLFERISENWILGTTAPGKKYAAQVVVKLNKAWEAFSAYVEAPRGSRIAEQLLRSAGGKVDLNTLDVPRFVEWYPLWKEEGWSLARCEATLSASGKYTNIGATYLAKDYLQEFITLLGTKPLPETDKLTGHTV